ncbi:hypothetical protein SteCoe_32805 [Stentor coeruleus]|uniref:Uncharacterized protein n=1 Tax=Stentor coeruleus TaxID=5963 RepID=A0A1R2AY63_9CILI|nr:hypothetical protein SteCoe_32805 [Stentor coeruleus]
MQDDYTYTYEDDFDDEPAAKTLSEKLVTSNNLSNPNITNSLKSSSISNIDTSSNIKILSKSSSSDKLSTLINENSSLKYQITLLKEKIKKLQSRKPKSIKSGRKSCKKSLSNEYLTIKNTYDKVFDYEFMIRLRDKIKQKEIKVQDLTNKITQTKTKLAENDKGIIIATSHSTNDLNRKESNHLMAMLIDMTENIRQIKYDMDKEQENNKKNAINEQELAMKLAQLETVYKFYDKDNNEDFERKRQIEYSMRLQKLSILNKKIEVGKLSAKNKIKILRNAIEEIQKDSEECIRKISVKNEEMSDMKKMIKDLSESLQGQKDIKNLNPNAEIKDKSIYFMEANSSMLENLLTEKSDMSKHPSSELNTEKTRKKGQSVNRIPIESPIPFYYTNSNSPQGSKSSLKKKSISTNPRLQSIFLEKTNRFTSITRLKTPSNHVKNPYTSILSELDTKLANKNKKSN